MYHVLSLLFFLSSLGLLIAGIRADENLKKGLIISGVLLMFLYPFILEFLYLIKYKLFRGDPSKDILTHNHKLFQGKIPVCYRHEYNFTACGLEKLHPFDSHKYQNVYTSLISNNLLSENSSIHKPEILDRNILMDNLDWWYILKLNYSVFISKYIELPLCFVPSEFLRFRLLNPMMMATQGTIDASCFAIDKGWAINIAGGYHHAHLNCGGGFCIYPDITLAVRNLRKFHSDLVKKVMIIDLDAHQGNGHERDFLNDENVFILDVYNPHIYPMDTLAKAAISKEIHVTYSTSDEDYLALIERSLENSLADFVPDFIIYNAGTDCIKGDPLGNLNLSSECIVSRDQIVFDFAFKNRIPIIMLLSGGYQKINAKVIADSIINLASKFEQIGRELKMQINFTT